MRRQNLASSTIACLSYSFVKILWVNDGLTERIVGVNVYAPSAERVHQPSNKREEAVTAEGRARGGIPIDACVSVREDDFNLGDGADSELSQLSQLLFTGTISFILSRKQSPGL